MLTRWMRMLAGAMYALIDTNWMLMDGVRLLSGVVRSLIGGMRTVSV